MAAVLEGVGDLAAVCSRLLAILPDPSRGIDIVV